MCILPENEQFAAVDETADWGVTHLRQPRHDNVIPMPTKPVHELHAHVQPETGNTTGSKALDFAAFWFVDRASSVVIGLLCLVIVSMLAGWAYQELSMSDWGKLLVAIGGAL